MANGWPCRHSAVWLEGATVDLFFSMTGRIGRGRWWLASIVLWVLFVGVLGVNWTAIQDAGITAPEWGATRVVTTVLAVLLIWPNIAVGVKRWHDRGKSGWWMLIYLVPVIGALWALVELGFLEGDSGANEYGPDPLTSPR